MTSPRAPRPTVALAVVESRQAAAEQRLVTVDGGAAAADYTTPGQVVEMEDGGARAFMVIASHPSERPLLAFLIRTGRGPVGERVAEIAAGGTVTMTRPFGPGFRLERAAGLRLVCCVAGTGIAAVRPVLAELAATRATLAGVRLYYGVRTRAHVAFRPDLEAWAARGLAVRLCLSQERPAEAWDRAGRVPVVLAAEETDLADAAIVLAGPRDMGPMVEAVATAAGMPAERLLMNF